MTLVATMMVLATVNASNKGVESVVEATTDAIAPFTKVNVNVPSRIRVVQGTEYGVMVNNAHLESMPMLNYNVKDGVLYISTTCTDMLAASGRETVITIITPSGDIDIKAGRDMEPLRRNR